MANLYWCYSPQDVKISERTVMRIAPCLDCTIIEAYHNGFSYWFRDPETGFDMPSSVTLELDGSLIDTEWAIIG